MADRDARLRRVARALGLGAVALGVIALAIGAARGTLGDDAWATAGIVGAVVVGAVTWGVSREPRR